MTQAHTLTEHILIVLLERSILLGLLEAEATQMLFAKLFHCGHWAVFLPRCRAHRSIALGLGGGATEAMAHKFLAQLFSPFW